MLDALRESPLGWLLEPTVLGVLAGSSVLLFVLSLAGVPFFLARLPEDWLTRDERQQLGLPSRRGPLGWLLWILRNAVGIFLLLAGVAMLVLPGQGLLTMLVGVLLTDVPGKHRVERWIAGRPWMLRAIDAIRARAGAPPLRRPPPRDGPERVD
ncbi:MAG: hypothetical protein RIT45_3962 [Pseudomonadota bacterium]|jgi:hypothetical protein